MPEVQGIWPVDEVRAAERALMATLPDGTLMRRAAAGLATECVYLLGKVYGSRVVVLVGSGDNGGDALFAGARLARRGARVTALLMNPERAHSAGLSALLRVGGGVAQPGTDVVAAADLVIDGIVGIGGNGSLRGPAVDLAEAAEDVLTVAVDVPSGVSADTGEVGDSSISADVTVTFGAIKPGLVTGAGAEQTGEVRFVDIGLAPHLPPARAYLLEGADVAAVLPRPESHDDKYTRGVVGVLAGSPLYGGAGVLATGSAIHGGAGMVRYLGLMYEQIRARYPEVVVHENTKPSEAQVQAWVVGPGMGTDDEARQLLADVLGTDVPVIVDADGITLLAQAPHLLRERRASTVITPHDREFTRLGCTLGGDRLESARRAAAELGVTVLLKGNATVVAAPNGHAFVNPTGTPWLATAGSGDVLSGLVGSLLASGMAPALAAAVGAYVHGVAGQLAATDGPPSAADVLAAVRPALASISRD